MLRKPRVDRADGGSLVRGCLDDALQGLSEDQREVIILFHQLDWPIAIIAAHMDMPEGTVKSHLHRGRQRLREMMVRDARFAAHESGVKR
jgi:DNA-directed RNA polymerase specialized sigma24 family protein